MIVVTMESLIRGNFFLSTPIKCSCGMLHPRNKPRADWLAQRGGRSNLRGAGSIPRGLTIFLQLWDCMALFALPGVGAVRFFARSRVRDCARVALRSLIFFAALTGLRCFFAQRTGERATDGLVSFACAGAH